MIKKIDLLFVNIQNQLDKEIQVMHSVKKRKKKKKKFTFFSKTRLNKKRMGI